MVEGEQYQLVYRKILASHQLQSLSRFKNFKSFNLIYPDAHTYPEFFNNNLLSQGRVIKVVKGKTAVIRAFCYQLMKLIFEIEVPDVNYVQIFKNVVYHPALLLEDADVQSPTSGRTYTDRQYKRFLAEFIEIMGQQSIPNFQLTLMEYPIVDQSLTRIMEGLVLRCFPREQPYDTEELLEWLSKTFDVGVERHGQCYRFQESDVFIYEQNTEQFYITYLSEMAQVSDYSESTNRFDGLLSKQKISGQKSCDNSTPSPKKQHSNTEVMDDYNLPLFSNDKYRYSAQIYNRRTDEPALYRKTIENHKTFSKDLNLETEDLGQNDKPSDKYSKIGSLLDIMSDRSSKDLSQPYKTSEELSSGQLSQEQKRLASERVMVAEEPQQTTTPHFHTNNYLQDDPYNPFTKKYSEQYMTHLYEKNLQFQYDKKETNNPFGNDYKNQFYSYSHQTQSQQYGKQEDYHFISRNNTLIDSLEVYKPKEIQEDLIYKPKPIKKIEKSYKEYEPEDSRGTLYRQFTDTRVLEVMNPTDRLKIDLLRTKYKGKHHRDLYKPY